MRRQVEVRRLESGIGRFSKGCHAAAGRVGALLEGWWTRSSASTVATAADSAALNRLRLDRVDHASRRCRRASPGHATLTRGRACDRHPRSEQARQSRAGYEGDQLRPRPVQRVEVGHCGSEPSVTARGTMPPAPAPGCPRRSRPSTTWRARAFIGRSAPAPNNSASAGGQPRAGRLSTQRARR